MNTLTADTDVQAAALGATSLRAGLPIVIESIFEVE